MPHAGQAQGHLEERGLAVLAVDADGTVHGANDVAARLLGIDPAALDGALLDALLEGSPARAFPADGPADADGRPTRLVVIEGAHAARGLAAALEPRAGEHGAVLAALPEGVIVHDADGALVLANHAACRLVGLQADTAAGTAVHDRPWPLLRGDGTDLPAEEHPSAITLRTGVPVRRLPVGVRRPDGRVAWLEASSTRVALPGDLRPGVICMLVDVTDRRSAELALAEREARFRTLLERSTDVIVATLDDGTITYATPSVRQLLGRSPEEVVGRPLATLLHPDDRARRDQLAALVDAGAAGHGRSMEVRMLRADGSEVPVEVTGGAIRDGAGNVIGRQASFRSIERRKAAEAEAEARAAHYRALARSLPGAAVLLFDHELRYIVAEGEALAELGELQVVGRTPVEVFAVEGLEAEARYRRALAGETVRIRYERPDGRVFDATVAPVRDGARIVGGLALALDVTTEARLAEEREALLEIAHAAAAGTELGDLLALVARRVAGLFGGVGAGIFRFDDAGGQTLLGLEPAGLGGYGLGERTLLGEGSAVGAVASTGAPAALRHGPPAAGDDPVILALRALGAVGAIAAPVVIQRRVWGALAVGTRDADRLDAATAARLGRFADLAAATIANAEARDALRRREAQFRSLAEDAADTIFRTLPDSTITYVSPAVRTLLGHEPEDLIGRRMVDLMHAGDERHRGRDVSRLPTTPGVGVPREARMQRADGRYEWIEASSRTILDVTGAVVERQAMVRSVQRRKEAEALAEEQAARYRALARSLPNGAVFVFDHDLRYVLAEGPALARAPGSRFVGKDASYLLPEDAAANAERLFRAALEGRTSTLRSDRMWPGAVYDVTVAPVREGERIIAGMVLVLDVTERARAEAEDVALREIAQLAAHGPAVKDVLDLVVERVAELFDAVAAGVMRFEPDGGRVVAASSPPHLAALTTSAARFGDGTPEGTVLAGAGPVVAAEYGETDDPIVVALRRLGAVGGAAAPIEIGHQVWGTLAIGCADPAVLVPAIGERLARFADIAAVAIANAAAWETLSLHAATDPLTGLANRRVFDTRLRGEVARARRRGRQLSLLLIDLDRFKHINDTWGHPVGDRVIADVAAAVFRESREGDLVARVGGDELAWILPDEPLESALVAAERARAAVEALAGADAGTPAATISIGAASLAGSADAEDLKRLADAALYQAKAEGRNRVGHGATPVAALDAPSAARAEAMAAVRTLARLVDAKAPSTLQHSERVAALAERLALELGWPERRARLLRETALIHDVGKIAVLDAVLLEPAALPPHARASLARHPALGAEIAAEAVTAEQAAWIRGHHERYDGGGYPDGLVGDAIPPGAQILAVAERFDAITNVRVHRAPLPAAEAVRACRDASGTELAPAVVDALVALNLRGELAGDA